MNINLKALIGKLNDTCRQSLESAAGLCLSRTHYDVEIEHWFMKLFENPLTDITLIFNHFGVNASRVLQDLQNALDRLKTGNSRTPAFSPRIPELIQKSWTTASINYDSDEIRSGYIILALLTEGKFQRIAREISEEFALISPENLQNKFFEIVKGSGEGFVAETASSDETAPAGTSRKTPALDKFTINLTFRAQNGEIDPVLGRDWEIRQMIDILTRRRKNNPILVGEAGVGKTAVVEGFALRIAKGDVPPALQNVLIRILDLAQLQAGAGIKGEFENRLKSVIQEVKSSPQPVILFIDEAHTLIGAGGQAGQGDAANLLKPALARGELRTIAATTWGEFKKYIEKDPALERRFEPVKVAEPSETQAIGMMRGLVLTLEKHHQVRVLDEAVEAAVRLSHRYISGRQLPDKCLGVLDTACARVAVGHSATPPAIEDCQRQLNRIAEETRILQRESKTGIDHRERLNSLAAEKVQQQKRLTTLNSQWETEKSLVEVLQEKRETIETINADDPTAASLQNEFSTLSTDLKAAQQETPLLYPHVDAGIVADIISDWTGIPVGKMLGDEVQSVLELQSSLEASIVGQSAALSLIGKSIRTARAGLEDPNKPVGVFLLVGPSGTGKTLTARTLADVLYGGERKMVTINMSEYQEAHTVSGLKGAPAGYVGFGEGGILTEAVRRNPYCVLLLDEIEKAHRDVRELFYQVFDKGELRDGEGRLVNFKNTVIFLTSNVASDKIMTLCADESTCPPADKLAEIIRPDLLKVFEPAFLGRLNVVPYFPISDDVMKKITHLELARIRERLLENRQIEFSYDDAVADLIAARCTEVETGARNVDHILTRSLLPEISDAFLAKLGEGESISTVHVSISNENSFQFEIR